jgi:hypothetical protein
MFFQEPFSVVMDRGGLLPNTKCIMATIKDVTKPVEGSGEGFEI